MKNVKFKKNKNWIFVSSFILAFIIIFTVAYRSYASTKEYFLGDMNGDNKITISDELLLLRHIYSVKTETNENWKLKGDAIVNADINEDKKIDMSDLLCIKRYILAQKDTNVAEKHTEWAGLCKKIIKDSEIIKSYTLAIKPGNQTYTKETKTAITVTAPEENYVVSFNGNGGISPESVKSVKNFSNWTLSGEGMIENKEASPTTYIFGEGDATLTANYDKKGNEIILPNAQREGYAVEGWYDTSELKNKVGNVGDTYSPTQDITLYAKWEYRKIEPISIKLNKTNLVLDVSDNKTERLTAQITPANSNYNTKLKWTSSNPDVVNVTEAGELTGIANGTANIIVQTENGKSVTCNVTVQTSPTGVILDVTEKTIDLSGNKTFTIKPKIIPSTANVNKKIQIKSSNTDVATISTNGEVTGKANGTTDITFRTENGRFATCKVNVVTSPTNIILDKTAININSEESTMQTLTATILPVTSSINTNLIWTSSNTKIATVSNNGEVRGIATGTAVITVETENGKKASCEVNVKIDKTDPVDPVEPIKITLNKTSATIDLAESNTEKIIATTNSLESLTWSSSNINVATVSDDGLVTAKANGETTIMVSDKTGVSATCNVTVQTSPTGITLNITEQTLDMSSNTSFVLTPTIIPSTANVNRQIRIKSSNTEVAAIATNGEVTGVANGTAVITFSTTNGKEATCKVTVQTSPTSIALDETSIAIDTSVENTKKLTAKITPATSNIYTGLTWRSNNTNIATVSNNGLVTGKANGTAMITVETENGKTATCEVEVKTNSTDPTEPAEPSTLKLNKNSMTIDLAESNTETLIATTNAPGGLNWSSNNTDVATVSRDGVVTGKANGKATITVIDSSGKIVTCEVTVQTSPTSVTLNVMPEQTLDLSENKTFKIVANIEPSTANINNNINFQSTNLSVATVSSDGLVTGISNGTTEIIAKTGNGKEAKCTVTVQTSPTGVTLNVTEQTLDLNGVKKFKIIANIEPSTANVNTTLHARSSNPNVATISGDGTVTAISGGNAIITIETENGKSATCNVTVKAAPISATAIYFAENKDDDTKYITVKKGENKTIKAIMEPSDASEDITYSIISGNSKVASIDPKTGEIIGKQAGIVTIQAETSSGKKATIRLNVRIGNEVFDTYSTIKLKANTSESLLYSRAVDFSKVSAIGEASHLQTFAMASNEDIYYCSYPGGTTGTTNTSAKMNITIGRPNETPYKCMTVHYFGHGSGFDLEKGSGGGKVWIDSITAGNSAGKYNQGYGITRLQWANKSEYYFAAGTVKIKDTSGKVLKTYVNNDGENFIFTSNGEVQKLPLRAAVDETNGLVGIKKGNYYYVFDLNEALAINDKTYESSSYIGDYKDCILEYQAKDLSEIKPLTSFKMPTATSEEDVTYYAWQGFDLDGDYIYIGEGHYTNKVSPTLYNGKAFVSVFNYMYAYNGNKLEKKKTEVVAVNEEWIRSQSLLSLMGDNGSGKYDLAQLEGIRVTTQGGVKELCLGFDSEFKSTGKRSANILKYTY